MTNSNGWLYLRSSYAPLSSTSSQLSLLESHFRHSFLSDLSIGVVSSSHKIHAAKNSHGLECISRLTYCTGVVKYVANGAVIRSTIERPFRKGDWLLENGDFIQIIVLQNYLFFGNASAVYNYISSMFLRSEGGDSGDNFECRKPKYLILVGKMCTHR
jgi:hypothetical protein